MTGVIHQGSRTLRVIGGELAMSRLDPSMHVSHNGKTDARGCPVCLSWCRVKLSILSTAGAAQKWAVIRRRDLCSIRAWRWDRDGFPSSAAAPHHAGPAR